LPAGIKIDGIGPACGDHGATLQPRLDHREGLAPAATVACPWPLSTVTVIAMYRPCADADTAQAEEEQRSHSEASWKSCGKPP
jgi:hypothetical protein